MDALFPDIFFLFWVFSLDFSSCSYSCLVPSSYSLFLHVLISMTSHVMKGNNNDRKQERSYFSSFVLFHRFDRKREARKCRQIIQEWSYSWSGSHTFSHFSFYDNMKNRNHEQQEMPFTPRKGVWDWLPHEPSSPSFLSIQQKSFWFFPLSSSFSCETSENKRVMWQTYISPFDV